MLFVEPHRAGKQWRWLLTSWLLTLVVSQGTFGDLIVQVCFSSEYLWSYPFVGDALCYVHTSFAVDMLKHHRVQQLELRMKAGSNWQEKNLVFTGLQGNYLNPRYFPKMLDKVLVEADLPHIRFHDLRHGAATLLLSMGVHVKVVQEILGHSNISMTADTYSHVLPSMQREAMGKWGDKLKSSDSENREAR